jgi:hypothetical protein
MTDQIERASTAKKERSPSFPFISLRQAVKRTEAFWDRHKRFPTRLTDAAQTWGYSPKSSGNLQTVAALKAYGLLEEVGTGSDRKVQLTDLAVRIVNDKRPGVREEWIQEAALKPKWLAEYARRWRDGRPADNHCVSELTLDHRFTVDAAKTFLKVFDDTMRFADLRKLDKMHDNIDEEEPDGSDEAKDGEAGSVEVGDFVQWESQGAWQFATPLPVTEIRQEEEHGRFVFVEGHRAGLPMNEVHVVQKGRPNPKSAASQSYVPTKEYMAAPLRPLIERATFPLPEGVAAVEIPTRLSQESYDDLEAWLQIVLRKAKRTVH